MEGKNNFASLKTIYLYYTVYLWKANILYIYKKQK